jgi:hypothetical protein
MILGISAIGSGTLPPPVGAYYQRKAPPQGQANPSIPSLLGGVNSPSTFQQAPGFNFGQNPASNTTDGASFNQPNFIPTHTFAMWNQEFYGNPLSQDPKTFVNAAGETADENTREGVMAHELAHFTVAQEYGIPTGPPVVEMGGPNGLPKGGHVSLQTASFDPNRVKIEGQDYVDRFRRSMGEGLIASAKAPEEQIQAHGHVAGLNTEGYGELSQADRNIIAQGYQNLATVDAFERTPEGQFAKNLKHNPSALQAQNRALMAQHPDLMTAFVQGQISA